MNTDVIAILNTLIETTRDAEQGFQKFSEHAKNESIKLLFLKCSNDCSRAVNELQALVIQIGGKPETSGSIGGALYRGWAGIKASISNEEDLALLQECERGRDISKKCYQQALDSELPIAVRAIVEHQYQTITRNYDRIREVRNQFEK